MYKVKYLIVGAGITGLSFATFCDSNDYLIIERESQAGGYCRSFYSGEYVWDYAGHFYHFRNPNIKEFFLANIDNTKLVLSKKNTKIHYKDQLINYPFQMNIHQLPKDEFIECLVDLFNKSEKQSYDDFLDMLYGKFGRSIVEKFLRPYNEKLYACDLKTLDPNAMGRFFPYADIKNIINNMKNQDSISYNDEFIYHKEGAYSFIRTLLSRLDNNKILLSEEMIDIDIHAKKVFTINEVIEYEYLINTTPFDKFYKIIDSKKYAVDSRYLVANKVIVFNLGFDKPSTDTSIHWLYFPEKKYNFYRIGFYNNILHSNKMSLYVEVGFNREEEIDVSDLFETVLSDLKASNIISNQKLVDYNYVVMDPAYVHINNKGSELVQIRKSNWNKFGVYSIGRYGSWTYCSMEDCVIEARKVATDIVVRN